MSQQVASHPITVTVYVYHVYTRADNLWLVGVYHRGQLHGQVWRGCLGGGYLTGRAEGGDLTGDSVAYIFPNLEGEEET